MTKILSIDSTTEACSVALLCDDEITEQYQVAPRQHANLLLPFVEQVLAEAQIGLTQLDAIACNVGPGAFTGLRIGISVAQGLAYGANLPAIAVSSLANLAQQAFDKQIEDYCWSAIDARMSEVYFGAYRRNSIGLAELIESERVIAPGIIDFSTLSATTEGADAVLMGSGWQAYREDYQVGSLDFSALVNDSYPRARASLTIAKQAFNSDNLLQPEALQPVYLRNNVAKKKSKSN